MCGLIYGESFTGQPVNKAILAQYQKQKLRGQEGFGLYDSEYSHLIRATKERKIVSWLKNYPSTSVLFHHRFPTSTDNVKNACHPFSTRQYFATNYILVHNGWISNASELKAAHEAIGIEYYSVQPDGRFNDSEALLWDVALYLEGEQDELQAEGPIAFICMALPKDRRKSRKLYFGRNTNPLNMVVEQAEGIFLSSEGEGEPIEANQLYSFNYRSKRLDQKDLHIPRYPAWEPQTTYPKVYTTWQQDLLDEEQEVDGEFYLFEALPPTLSFTYQNTMQDTKPGTDTYVGTVGVLDLKEEVRIKATLYLEEAYGLYEVALDMLDDDLDRLTEAQRQDRGQGFMPDEDLALEKDLLRAAINVLYSSPYYEGRTSIDPGYSPDVTAPQLLTA